MKFWLSTIFLIFATFLVKNAESVSESGERPKLNKTFDEIFGKGWDAEVPEFTETKEWHKMETQTTEVENKSTDQPNPNEQSFSDHFEIDAMFDENCNEDDIEFIEEDEADSTDQNDCIDGQKCQKVEENDDPGTKKIKRRKNVYSEQQKREIFEEFIKKKNEFKQKGKYSRKEWDKNYTKISKSVGVAYNTIKKWKKLGLSIKLQLDKERKEKLKEYCEIKRNNPKVKDFEIAESLNIGRSTLKQWKKDIKNAVKDESTCSLQKELDQISQAKGYSDQQKREILKQFDEIKSKCKKAKLKNISMRELDKKIAKKLGVSASTIIRWKRKFGLSVRNQFSDSTKIGILKKYAKIKGKNPKMSDCDNADLLNIARPTFAGWKAKFMRIVNDKHAEEAESTDHDEDVDE